MFLNQRRLQPNPSFLLQRCQVVAEVFNTLLNDLLVEVIPVKENLASSGHVGRAVGGDIRAKHQNVRNVVFGEFSAVTFGQCG